MLLAARVLAIIKAVFSSKSFMVTIFFWHLLRVTYVILSFSRYFHHTELSVNYLLADRTLSIQQVFTRSKSSIGTLDGVNMFKVLVFFTSFSVADFEHEFICWVPLEFNGIT